MMTVAILSGFAALAAWRATRTKGFAHWCAQSVQLSASVLLIAFALHTFQSKGDAVSDTAARTDHGDPIAQKLADAREAMKARDYVKARDLYVDAHADGAAAAESMGGAAECSYYLKEDARALAECEMLMGNERGVGVARLIRGLIAERRGDREEARHEYESGARANNPICSRQLVAIQKGG